MPSVVALGSLAGQISKGFEMYPEYDVYQIGVGLKESKYAKGIKRQGSVEEYEANPPPTKRFLKGVSRDVVFICTGTEPECGAALRVMETIKDKNITVIYLRSDLELVSETERMQDKVAFNVLQQYARSGLLERIYLVDVTKLDVIIGETPITEYADKQAQLVASTYHMVQVFQNSQPVFGNMLPSEKVNRISTLGLTEIGEKEDKWFFSMDNSFENYYLYAVSEELLNEDKRLLNNIKKQVKSRLQDNTKVMFGIYPTSYEQNYVFCMANTKFIQGEENT
jgi:hypothetical protein